MLALVLGTRPEIIKLSPLIRELAARRVPFSLIHTNQHYSPEMDAVFFEQLRLPAPDFNLGASGGTPSMQTARILEAIEPILARLTPDAVVVQGDTNSVLAAALSAAKAGIPVAHVEAGLRSHDLRMPEEYNRILTDHFSAFLFPPTAEAAANLEGEGIGRREVLTAQGPRTPCVHISGNTVVDATMQNLALTRKPPTPEKFVLLTVHRAENVDDPAFLKDLAAALTTVALPILAPLHPRTMKNLERFGLTLPVTVLPPQGYLEFLALEKAAQYVITDSGGVQEEACTLGIPCVTVRKTTDRPETVTAGANLLAGTSREGMAAAFANASRITRGWKNPYGDGHAASTITDVLMHHLPQGA
ncbi:UDP-N-acetylglucosamine 2-epimerase (non-hydrolyzing) [Candidatus Micrarchaeota archaeon]|nr:UDP-N-acetylglucosamine 2-epimerase (non-hydrolyzing) [Candidatus Micrarchaeota archaeon]